MTASGIDKMYVTYGKDTKEKNRKCILLFFVVALALSFGVFFLYAIHRMNFLSTEIDQLNNYVTDLKKIGDRIAQKFEGVPINIDVSTDKLLPQL